MRVLTDEQQRQIEDYLEGAFSGEDLLRLEKWLDQSPEGREYLRFLKGVDGTSALPRKTPPADLTNRIMSRLEKPAPKLTLAWGKLGLAAACLILLLGALRLFRPQGASQVSMVEVPLSLDAPGARKVEVAGDFTGWKKVALQKQDGRWETRVKVVAGREYQYAFILNGRVLIIDPGAANLIRDRHGDFYSVLEAVKRQAWKGKDMRRTVLLTWGLAGALLLPPAAYAEETLLFLNVIQKQAKASGLGAEGTRHLLDQAKLVASKGVPEKVVQEVAEQALMTGKGPMAEKALDRLSLLVSEGLAPEAAQKVVLKEARAQAKAEEKVLDEQTQSALDQGLKKKGSSPKALTPEELEEKLEAKRQEFEDRMEKEKEIRTIQHEASEKAP